jgi:hypothetical protein
VHVYQRYGTLNFATADKAVEVNGCLRGASQSQPPEGQPQAQTHCVVFTGVFVADATIEEALVRRAAVGVGDSRGQGAAT